MSSASRAWQNLSAANQAAWSSYANGHPITDALGQSIKLTGHQYFNRCQAGLFNVAGPAITTPPVSATVVPEVLQAFAVAASGTAIVIRATGAHADFVALAVSKYTSLGVNFQKTYSQILASAADVGAFDISTQLITVAGSIAVGTKAWLRLRPVNQYGLPGTYYYAQTTVVATMPNTAPVTTSPAPATVTVTWAGAPLIGTVLVQQAPAAIGPWGAIAVNTALASPAAALPATTGNYARSATYDPATGLFSNWSAAVLVT